MFQVTASILQPLVGLHSDRRPLPSSLAGGMVMSLVGLVALATAPAYPVLLLAAGLIGLGSAVFRPEASPSRYSRWAAMPARRWGR